MVNYPHKKKATLTSEKNISFGKRGMSFEDDLTKSNEHYLAVQIVKVHYPKRAAAVITEAYFRTPSTTDFNGIFKGRYIDFEAKETSNATIFPLQNLHEHQVNHMIEVKKHGGITFLLVKFSKFNEIYLLPCENLAKFWQEYKLGNRRSIRREEFAQYGTKIPEGAFPRIDYLKVVEELFL